MAGTALKRRLNDLEQAKGRKQPVKVFKAVSETASHFIGLNGEKLPKPAHDYIVIMRVTV